MLGVDAALEGRLGRAPEVRQTKSGKTMAVLNLAVDEGDNATTWVKALTFEERAEACQGLEAGAKVYVEGRLKVETWKGRDGVQRTGLTMLARVCQPLGRIGRRRPAPPSRQQGADWSAPRPAPRQEVADWSAAGRAHRDLDAAADAAIERDRDDDIDWDRGDPIPDLSR